MYTLRQESCVNILIGKAWLMKILLATPLKLDYSGKDLEDAIQYFINLY